MNLSELNEIADDVVDRVLEEVRTSEHPRLIETRPAQRWDRCRRAVCSSDADLLVNADPLCEEHAPDRIALLAWEFDVESLVDAMRHGGFEDLERSA